MPSETAAEGSLLHLRFTVMTPTPQPTQQCSIALWQGYVSAQFYARGKDLEGALGLSPAFRMWRLPWSASRPMREDLRVLAALVALEADLLSDGWQRMRRAPGSEWYELRFRRGSGSRSTGARSNGSPASQLRAVEAPPESTPLTTSARRGPPQPR